MKTPYIRSGFGYFLHTLQASMYWVCDSVTQRDMCLLYNELDGGSGGNDLISLSHVYSIECPSGAEHLVEWVDGTNGQVWNWKYFIHKADMCNPESTTYDARDGHSMYKSVDMFRNVPGHTWMKCDRAHAHYMYLDQI